VETTAVYLLCADGVLYVQQRDGEGRGCGGGTWERIGDVGLRHKSIAVDCNYLYGVNEDLGIDFQFLADPSRERWVSLAMGRVVAVGVSRGTVYGVGEREGGDRLYRLARTADATWGPSPWERASKGRCCTLAVYGDTVYTVGTNDWIYRQQLMGLSEDSSWEKAFPAGGVTRSLAILGGGAALGVVDGRLWCYSPSSKAWSLEQEEQPAAARVAVASAPSLRPPPEAAAGRRSTVAGGASGGPWPGIAGDGGRQQRLDGACLHDPSTLSVKELKRLACVAGTTPPVDLIEKSELVTWFCEAVPQQLWQKSLPTPARAPSIERRCGMVGELGMGSIGVGAGVDVAADPGGDSGAANEKVRGRCDALGAGVGVVLGDRVMARCFVHADAEGYLQLEVGAEVDVLHVGSEDDDSEGWFFGGAANGEQGWVPCKAVLPTESLDRSETTNTQWTRGDIACATVDCLQTPMGEQGRMEARVLTAVPAAGTGYLALEVVGALVLIEYTGSSATGDAGWMFGRAATVLADDRDDSDCGVYGSCCRGWFPESAVERLSAPIFNAGASAGTESASVVAAQEGGGDGAAQTQPQASRRRRRRGRERRGPVQGPLPEPGGRVDAHDTAEPVVTSEFVEEKMAHVSSLRSAEDARRRAEKLARVVAGLEADNDDSIDEEVEAVPERSRLRYRGRGDAGSSEGDAPQAPCQPPPPLRPPPRPDGKDASGGGTPSSAVVEPTPTMEGSGSVNMEHPIGGAPVGATAPRIVLARSEDAEGAFSLDQATRVAIDVGVELMSAPAPAGFAWEYPICDAGRQCFVGHLPNCFGHDRLRNFLCSALRETRWTQCVDVGRPLAQCRQVAWMVSGGCRCPLASTCGSASLPTLEPCEFTTWMLEVMGACMPLCGLRNPAEWPNSCSLECYADGDDTLWCTDALPLFLGRPSPHSAHLPARAISLVLGEDRAIELRVAKTGAEPCSSPQQPRPSAAASAAGKVTRLKLQSGDLLTMDGSTLSCYEHRLLSRGLGGLSTTSPCYHVVLRWRWIVAHYPSRCGR